jgi:hypothetical protein
MLSSFHNPKLRFHSHTRSATLSKNLAETRRHWCNEFTNDEGRITAWTFIPKAIATDVLNGTVQQCPMEFSADEPLWQMAYEWMKDAMDEAGLKGRVPGINPWWCWIRVGNGQDKPTHLHACESHVLLELSLSPDQVLLSDFHMWHVPLNYWMHAEDEAEEVFERELSAAGLNIYRDKPLPEPFHTRVLDSWRSVFSLDVESGFTCKLSDKGIQGVFWQLSPDVIRGIVEPDEHIEIEDDLD